VKTLSIVATIAFFSLSVGRVAAAQDTTGTISGRTVDSQGLVLPGVTVTATGPQGARTTVTDGEGRFTLAFLTPGLYTVHAELQGFMSIDRPDVAVRVGQTVDIPLTMQIGALEETVQVVSAKPPVDTTSAAARISIAPPCPDFQSDVVSATRSTSRPA
jgi:hypothetical protein